MVQYAVPRVWVSVGGNRKMGTMWDERAKISLNTHTEILSQKQRDSEQEITLSVIDAALCAFGCMYFAQNLHKKTTTGI